MDMFMRKKAFWTLLQKGTMANEVTVYKIENDILLRSDLSSALNILC